MLSANATEMVLKLHNKGLSVPEILAEVKPKTKGVTVSKINYVVRRAKKASAPVGTATVAVDINTKEMLDRVRFIADTRKVSAEQRIDFIQKLLS